MQVLTRFWQSIPIQWKADRQTSILLPQLDGSTLRRTRDGRWAVWMPTLSAIAPGSELHQPGGGWASGGKGCPKSAFRLRSMMLVRPVGK